MVITANHMVIAMSMSSTTTQSRGGGCQGDRSLVIADLNASLDLSSHTTAPPLRVLNRSTG
jgi:hypothetical protein